MSRISTSGMPRVSAAGGEPRDLTRLGAGEVAHRHPVFLPGGRVILFAAFTSITGLDDATIEAIQLAARTEGMLTDPVYEGKSMAGLIGMVRSGEIPPGSRVLYAHLGGQPALSAYAHTPGLGA